MKKEDMILFCKDDPEVVEMRRLFENVQDWKEGIYKSGQYNEAFSVIGTGRAACRYCGEKIKKDEKALKMRHEDLLTGMPKDIQVHFNCQV